MPALRIGVDSGGTFTDICIVDEATGRTAIWKVPSTPADPSMAITDGVREAMAREQAGGNAVVFFGHGTTVGTNALIQRRGARAALVTNEGFRDLLEIGRQRRPHLYDLQVDKPQVLVPRDRRLEVDGRLAHDGRVLRQPAEDDVRAVARMIAGMDVEAVAICFLYSFLDPTHEQMVARIVAQELAGDGAGPAVFITCSHEACPEFREFERISTTVVNAYLGPVIKGYLDRLAPRLRELGIVAQPHITQSNGGTITFDTAAQLPVRTVLSGPSTGVIGALEMARLNGTEDIITFDMGGTSTDVSLIEGGRPRMTTEAEVHGYPLKVPMVDIHTVGAGGGSIAYVDAGGLLKVGPRSAGADPGPVCYGLGNEEPTVTDANVVMQVLNPRELLGGRMPIDRQAALVAVERLATRLGMSVPETAAGIVRVVTANMARAIRVISVQRGHDPRDYCLVAFGGAGPVHAGRLALELDIPRILVPPTPGILCATGLLLTDLRRDFSVTRRTALTESALPALRNSIGELTRQAHEWLAAEGIERSRQRIVTSADMRYTGQNYEINVPLPADADTPSLPRILREAFESAHQRRYGSIAPEEPVEAVTVRVEASAIVDKPTFVAEDEAGSDAGAAQLGVRSTYFPEAGAFLECPVFDREWLRAGNQFAGPAIVEQMDATTLVLPGQVVRVDAFRNLMIESPGPQENHPDSG